jgi:predicted rRNA methylase YqxC with S4 and FtsJ domains
MTESSRGTNMTKQRLDSLLVARELAENQRQAQAIIMAGRVITKPGSQVDENASLELAEKIQLEIPPPLIKLKPLQALWYSLTGR